MFGSRKPQGSPASQPLPTPGNPHPSPNAAPANARPPVGFETVIGANTALKGDLTSHANVRIDGHFEGAINIDGNLMVGETAEIQADIHAHNLTISGAVHGNLHGNKVQIARTGRVWGDVSAAALTTEDGAYLEGKITMATHPAARGERIDSPILSALTVPDLSMVAATDESNGDFLDAEVVDETPQV